MVDEFVGAILEEEETGEKGSDVEKKKVDVGHLGEGKKESERGRVKKEKTIKVRENSTLLDIQTEGE
jgi:hypothetical protein